MDVKRPVKPSITSENNGDEGYRKEQVRENWDWRSEWRDASTCENSDHLFRMQCHACRPPFSVTVVYDNDNGETGNVPMVCTPSSIFLVISRRRWQCAYVFFGLLNSGP